MYAFSYLKGPWGKHRVTYNFSFCVAKYVKINRLTTVDSVTLTDAKHYFFWLNNKQFKENSKAKRKTTKIFIESSHVGFKRCGWSTCSAVRKSAYFFIFSCKLLLQRWKCMWCWYSISLLRWEACILILYCVYYRIVMLRRLVGVFRVI